MKAGGTADRFALRVEKRAGRFSVFKKKNYNEIKFGGNI